MLIELTLATSAVTETLTSLLDIVVEELPPVLAWGLHLAVGVTLALLFGAGVLDGLAAAGGSAIVTAVLSAVARYPAVPVPPFRR